MFTPKQQAHWDRLQNNPVFRKMADRLGLEPTESAEYKRNVQIKEKVELLLHQMEMAPKIPRHVIKPRKPWEDPDLSWLPEGSCPF